MIDFSLFIFAWVSNECVCDVYDDDISASYFLCSFPIQHLPSALVFTLPSPAFCFVVQCDLSFFLFFSNAWRFNDKSFFLFTHFVRAFKDCINACNKMHDGKKWCTVKPPKRAITKAFWQILLLKWMNSHDVVSNDAFDCFKKVLHVVRHGEVLLFSGFFLHFFYSACFY